MPTFAISAFSAARQERIHLFTWVRDARTGVERAKREASDFGMKDDLSDYQAEPLN